MEENTTEKEDYFYCKHHPENKINRVCNNIDCNKEAFICDQCVDEGPHQDHSTFLYQDFRRTLISFVNSSKTQQDLTKEGQLSYARMQNYLEETSQSIYKQSQKLSKLSSFMENLNETLLSLQEIGEEMDLAYSILINMDKKETQTDLPKLNEYLNNFKLLMDIEVNKHMDREEDRFYDKQYGKNTERYGGKEMTKDKDKETLKIQVKPSSISQLRIKNILDKKADFTSILRKTVDEHEQHFQKFLKDMGDLIKDHKQFLVPKPYENEEARTVDFGKRAIYNAYYKQGDQTQKPQKKKLGKGAKSKVKNEEDDEVLSQGGDYQLGAVEKCGIPKLDQGQPPQGIKKQMFKLCNYLIFYNTLMCDSILPEPILRGVPLKKMQQGELKFPIRCAFCRLLKIRSFVQFYFRFDLVSRFGKLCLFKDKEGREICSHEMCLLWSNRVVVNYTEMTVDIPTLIQAVQFAQAQMCRYCGSIGASLKCNRQECHVHYHFNCLKQVKLMGLQLDHEQKFRFFCEDHVRHNYQGQSDWFITRIRMKHIIQQGGQPAFTKKHQQIDWSTRDAGGYEMDSSDDERKRR